MGAALAARGLAVPLSSGSIAASAAARELIKDMVNRPQRTVDLLRQASQLMPRGPTSPGTADATEEQGVALVEGLRRCLGQLGVDMPVALHGILECPMGASHLCEMLVDELEAARPMEASGCRACTRSFLAALL